MVTGNKAVPSGDLISDNDNEGIFCIDECDTTNNSNEQPNDVGDEKQMKIINQLDAKGRPISHKRTKRMMILKNLINEKKREFLKDFLFRKILRTQPQFE